MMYTGLGLVFGLVGARRRRGRPRIAMLAAALAGSSAQGCCDPMVATDTSSVGELSSTGDEAPTIRCRRERSVPPADVFAFGTDEDVSEVVVKPGDSCDSVIIRTFHVESMYWGENKLYRGNACAKPVGDPADCILTLEWCDGEAPAPCE